MKWEEDGEKRSESGRMMAERDLQRLRGESMRSVETSGGFFSGKMEGGGFAAVN